MKPMEVNMNIRFVIPRSYYSIIPILGVHPKNKHELIPVTKDGINTCRESCIQLYSDYVKSNENYKPTSTTGVVLASSLGYDSKVPGQLAKVGRLRPELVEHSLRLLNDFEKKIGFKKTVAMPTVIRGPVYKDGKSVDVVLEDACYFIPDTRWFRYSYTMSLYFLFLRGTLNLGRMLMQKGIYDFDAFSSMFDSQAELKKLFREDPNEKELHNRFYGINTAVSGNAEASSNSTDLRFIFHTIKYWLPLMQNIETLFPLVKLAQRFDGRHVLKNTLYGGSHIRYEGIERLLVTPDMCHYIRKDLVYKTLNIK